MSNLKTELASVERKIQLSINVTTNNDTTDEDPDQKMANPDNSADIGRVKGVHMPRGIL